MKISDKPMYLDNVKKKEPTTRVINEENPRISEYFGYKNSAVKINNMPILFGNGCNDEKRNELNNSLLYWLNAENLFNCCVFDLADLTNNKFTALYDLAEKFLDKNNINYKIQSARNNCKNYRYYYDENNNNELILSPLTYNDGGIY